VTKNQNQPPTSLFLTKKFSKSIILWLWIVPKSPTFTSVKP